MEPGRGLNYISMAKSKADEASPQKYSQCFHDNIWNLLNSFVTRPEARLARQVICILEIFCWRQGGNLKIFVVGRNGGNAALVIVPDFTGFFKSKFDAYLCVFFLGLRLFPVCRKFCVQKRGKGIKIQNAKYRYEVQKANIKYTDSWECQCLWSLKRKIKEYKHDMLWSTLFVPYRCKNLKCSF